MAEFEVTVGLGAVGTPTLAPKHDLDRPIDESEEKPHAGRRVANFDGA
jgi:hypothetical protein